MNYKRILPVAALASMLLSSCDDQIMDWEKNPNHGEVTVAELPLALAEKISRYDVLKNYTDFKLGIGIGMDLYMDDDAYRGIVNANFDEVTVGYAMKHGAMVKSNGSLDFTAVDEFMAKTKEAGLSVYGHTLVWHQNQNASYLNGLIAPTVIPGAAGANLLSNGSFDNNITGWGSWGGGKQTVEYNATLGLSAGGCLKAVTGASAANLWDLEIQCGDVPVVADHRYQITFFIKSEGTGHVRIAFNNMNQSYPWISGAETVTTSSSWQQVTYNKTTLGTDLIPAAGKTTMNFRFDLGKDPNMTYYIDNVVMVDLDAPPVVTNLITNGNFEGGNLTGWSGWGNSSTRAVSAVGDGYGGAGYAMVLTNPTAANNYSAQQVYTFAAALEQGVDYTCTFMVKASTNANLQVEIQSANYSANYYGGIAVGTSWIQVQKTITPTTADRTKFVFDFGETACTYYIDDIVFAKASGGTPTGPTIIEKTDAEKAVIIGDAMESWISGMLGHYKADVHAWDVVNEPMLESGDVRNGTSDYTAGEEPDDYFSWPLYMGKDYAVTAFNLARQYGNANDVLFINDYNLESNLTKCDGLISYVQYIESKGATVDGIGTQMHISATTDTLKMKQMFEKLAATGKKIKISELDVRLGTASPTAAQLAAQANMYRCVLNAYATIIPAAQQYGVTIWGISDNEQEHEFWLPNESPNLWDANYARKHAYKGVADGLAGRDVSADFTGELQY